MRNLSLRDGKYLALGCTIRKWQGQALNPRRLRSLLGGEHSQGAGPWDTQTNKTEDAGSTAHFGLSYTSESFLDIILKGRVLGPTHRDADSSGSGEDWESAFVTTPKTMSL